MNDFWDEDGPDPEPIGMGENLGMLPSDLFAELICDLIGHQWIDAGGGLEICPACLADRWKDESS